MGRDPRILLLGDSVLMDSVAECLAKRRLPGVSREDYGSIGDRVAYLQPDLILFELGHPCSAQAIALLEQRPDLTMIGLDLNCSRVFVLGSYQRVIGNMEDLYQVVRAEIGRLENCPRGGVGDEMNWKNHSETKN